MSWLYRLVTPCIAKSRTSRNEVAISALRTLPHKVQLDMGEHQLKELVFARRGESQPAEFAHECRVGDQCEAAGPAAPGIFPLALQVRRVFRKRELRRAAMVQHIQRETAEAGQRYIAAGHRSVARPRP